MHDFIARWARLAPERVAIDEVAAAKVVTYATLDSRAQKLATALAHRLALPRGARVAALCSARSEVFELYVACARAGLVFVPLNTRLAAPQLAGNCRNAAPDLLVYDDDFAELAQAVRAACPIRSGIALGSLRCDGDDLAYEALLAAATPRDSEGGIALDATSLILYTSGTTGTPKGVEIPWRQVVFNAVNTALACDLTWRDSALAMLPLFHTGGLHCLATPLLHQGGRVVLTPRFDPAEAVSLLRDRGITTTIAVPTMYEMLLEAGIADAPLPELRALLCGGAPAPIPLIEAYHDAGLPLRQGYGLTEVGPNCFTLAPLEGPHRLGSVGWPAFHSEARLLSPDGATVTDDSPGELWLRGPHVTAGYFRAPELTARVLDAEGWFRTGDVLRRTSDGCYYVVGRVGEMFISGGENVYPEAVELALAQHPDIAQVAVVATADARWGQVGVAALVLRPGSAPQQPEALRAWARGHLAGFEIPKRWHVVDALPLGASGKVDRPALRRLLDV